MAYLKDIAMNKENELDRDEAEDRRREFLKRVGTAAAVAPAVALLLAANAKPAKAGDPYVVRVTATISAKRLKEFKRPTRPLLAAVEMLPVERWKYKKGVADEGEHIGPYAEDFRELFGVGDGETINVIDALGVCLKAIQELSAKVNDLESRTAG